MEKKCPLSPVWLWACIYIRKGVFIIAKKRRHFETRIFHRHWNHQSSERGASPMLPVIGSRSLINNITSMKFPSLFCRWTVSIISSRGDRLTRSHINESRGRLQKLAQSTCPWKSPGALHNGIQLGPINATKKSIMKCNLRVSNRREFREGKEWYTELNRQCHIPVCWYLNEDLWEMNDSLEGLCGDDWAPLLVWGAPTPTPQTYRHRNTAARGCFLEIIGCCRDLDLTCDLGLCYWSLAGTHQGHFPLTDTPVSGIPSVPGIVLHPYVPLFL